MLTRDAIKHVDDETHRKSFGASETFVDLRSKVSSMDQTAELQDTRVNVKVVLSGLWVSMLFVFAYVDIFGFWRADVINGALTKKVPGPGFAINQTFLALTTMYIIIPSLMIAFSLVAPARLSRPTNIVIGLLYAVTVIGASIGESWTYYILGSVIEVVLLLNIARVAWTWPRRSAASSNADV
jgi:Family of unknown function (DUF6326)